MLSLQEIDAYSIHFWVVSVDLGILKGGDEKAIIYFKYFLNKTLDDCCMFVDTNQDTVSMLTANTEGVLKLDMHLWDGYCERVHRVDTSL